MAQTTLEDPAAATSGGRFAPGAGAQRGRAATLRRLPPLLKRNSPRRSQPASLSQLPQLLGGFSCDRRERILVQHARDLLPISRAEQERGSRQIGIASSSLADFDQEGHFLLRY